VKQLIAFLKKLDDLKGLKLGAFEIILDDPSGDSFIENPLEPQKDPNMMLSFYKRTQEQNEMLGINVCTFSCISYN
jgi:zinc finger protein